MAGISIPCPDLSVLWAVEGPEHAARLAANTWYLVDEDQNLGLPSKHASLPALGVAVKGKKRYIHVESFFHLL